MAAAKDTIYIDVDDEITAVIDKVTSSPSKIVALVLPKRATVMQSVVNMKLLKRTAAEAKKSIVLITSESALLPIAGLAGLHVAKTLQSKPEIPEAPTFNDAPVSVDDAEDVVPVAAIDPNKSVGELAGYNADTDDDAIEVDNDDEASGAGVATAAGVTAGKKSFNKKLKVPNFDAFRNRLFLGGAVFVLLIVGYILAFFVLPKATITIKTNNVNVNTNLALTASTDAKAVDEKQGIVPAEIKQVKKTDSQKVPATGQKNQGTKASGSLTLTNCINDGQPHTVPAGTSFTSGQSSFVTDEAVTLDPALFSGQNCKSANFGLSRQVDVTAAAAGDQFNLSARDYTSPIAGITAKGSSMTGGTNKIVTVVSQQDVDNAKQKILDNVSAAARTELLNQMKTAGLMALTDTLSNSDPLVTASPNVDAEASEVTVNLTVTYSMTGAKQSDVQKLVEADINKHIDTKKQKILSNGVDKAVIQVSDKTQNNAKFTIQTVALAGVQQDSEAIKKAVAGKKKGEVQSIILARPGVRDVTVDYSPPWIFKTPKSTKKLTIVFQQSNGTTSSKQ